MVEWDHNSKVWFKAVLEELQAPLLRFVFAMCKNHQLAQDIVQDAFTKLLSQDPQAIKEIVRPWLFRTCKNALIDNFRRESKNVMLDDGLTIEQDLNKTGFNTSDPHLRAEQNQVFASICKLPEKYQTVMLMKFAEGYSYKDISSKTGFTESYVGVLIHAAVKTLRTKMQESNASPQNLDAVKTDKEKNHV